MQEQQDINHNPKLTRTNSFGGGLSVAASEDDRNNASLYINNNKVNSHVQAPSEADSDTIRKMTATNLKREFEQYQNKYNPITSNSEFTSNANVEFETISSGSNNHCNPNLLGKRSVSDVDAASRMGQPSLE